jgi:hypothetical protein
MNLTCFCFRFADFLSTFNYVCKTRLQPYIQLKRHNCTCSLSRRMSRNHLLENVFEKTLKLIARKCFVNNCKCRCAERALSAHSRTPFMISVRLVVWNVKALDDPLHCRVLLLFVREVALSILSRGFRTFVRPTLIRISRLKVVS